MKRIILVLCLLLSSNALAGKNECLSKGICSCKDYSLIFNDKLTSYNKSKNKMQKELRILAVNSYLNSLYKECRNTKYFKNDIVQKNIKPIKNKLKREVRQSLRNIEYNKPLY